MDEDRGGGVMPYSPTRDRARVQLKDWRNETVGSLAIRLVCLVFGNFLANKRWQKRRGDLFFLFYLKNSVAGIPPSFSHSISLSLSLILCRCVFKRVKPVMARATGQRKMLCTIKMWRVGWLVSSSFFFPRSRLDRMETLRRPRRGAHTFGNFCATAKQEQRSFPSLKRDFFSRKKKKII